MGEASSVKKKIEEESKYLELRAVFTAIEEFLRNVVPSVKDFISTILEPLNGAKLGKDIAEMYKALKESGMSEEMINKIIDKYLQKRLEELPTVTTLLKPLSEAISKGTKLGTARAAKGISGVKEKLEEIKEVAKEIKEVAKGGEEEKKES